MDSADKLGNMGKLDYSEKFGEIVEMVKRNLHVITMKEKGEEMLYWKDVYRLNGEQEVKKYLQNIVVDCNTNKVNELLNAIKRTTFKDRDDLKDSMKLDSLEMLRNPHLALKDQLINLDTLAFEPFNPNYYLRNQIPVTWKGTEYKQSRFWSFINEILPKEDVSLVQEIVGAMLVKDYLTKKFAIFEGPRNTGKTTLLKVIIALLGQKNVSSVSLQRLGRGDKFTNGPIEGKMANIRDELPIDLVRGIDQLKELTGRSMVQAERKFGSEFEFVSYAFMLFACNDLPPIAVDDMAFWDRVILVKFRKTFGGNVKPDRELEKKLTSPDELSAVLAWALEGLARLKANDWNFGKVSTAEETRDEYRRKSDTLEYCVKDRYDMTGNDEDYETKDDFFQVMKDYCISNGVEVWTKDKIGKFMPTLKDVDVLSDSISVREGDKVKKLRVWRRIKRKQDGDLESIHEEFVKMSYGELGFGAECEYCGKHNSASYRSQDNRLACEGCAKNGS